MLWGKGFRWMYYATGMPGWMRAGFGYPAFGFCRRFPWMPRWWWTGIYGPVEWTPQGPVLASQSAPVSIQFQPKMTKEQEIQLLEQEMKALEEELESIRNRLNELKK